jgi:hypothetical protein
LVAALLVATPDANADLADVFRSPRFARLGLAPLGDALAATVATTYPIATASSSVTYGYDEASDMPLRRPGVMGPIVGERAETLGAGRLDLALAYAFVDLDEIGGASLDGLVSKPFAGRRFLFFPVPDGITLRDGRTTTLLPVRVNLDLDVTAHIATPSLTYGVTPDLDVNVSVPVIRTRLHVQTTTRAPDPRRPIFALPVGTPPFVDVRSESDTSEGFGDVLLRAKYVVRRGVPVDLALGLGLSLPSGRTGDFQGTGTTRVQPALIASRRFGDRLEVLANAGVDLVADDVDRSVVRWALGGTGMLAEPLAVSLVFLGRHELAAPADPIALPFFFQIRRSDAVDAAVGLRWRLPRTAAVLSANALVPLTDDGLRADVVPTVAVEYVF